MKSKLFSVVLVTLLLISGCGKEQTNKESNENQPKILKVMIKKKNSKNLVVETKAEGKELTFAHYLYLDNKLLKKFPYKSDAHFSYKISKRGIYKVRVFVKNKNDKVKAKTTEAVRM
ncbi:hypothetical protein [Neobacillus kokaensis]|uniref:Lipoprotein n=1 Tax=Neobacillus kokaensis TaxID=2759023 RepID=A0ABQ3N4J6_9BACI|nr:hypothetical protein [Neobacillus kokaensis]GHH97450.1 hypothetical protein AM1BK_09930 [Neobacillus kokaensis]